MGARINYIFKDGTGIATVLYSHWGQDNWQHDIALALEHALPRWSDSSYGTRMMISHLIKDSIMDETGFGIYAINDSNLDLGEQTVVIDFTNHTITDDVTIEWTKFVAAYAQPFLLNKG
jgi:hypothetical protein